MWKNGKREWGVIGWRERERDMGEKRKGRAMKKEKEGGKREKDRRHRDEN